MADLVITASQVKAGAGAVEGTGVAGATVTLADRPRIITVRASAFPAAQPADVAGDVHRWPVDESALPGQIEYVGLESRATTRPDVTEARAVVSGGRAFRTSEEFEQYVGKKVTVTGWVEDGDRAQGTPAGQAKSGDLDFNDLPELHVENISATSEACGSATR